MPEIKVSRPTFNIAGQDSAPLGEGLLRLLIAEDLNGLYRCEATFGNWGEVDGASNFLYFDRRSLDFGKVFKVKLGTDTLFEGRITALEGNFPEGQSPEITVLAEDRFQDLRMVRRTRTFADASDQDIFSRIASDHGLSLSGNVSGPTYKVLAQVNQSDLAFVRERARAVDAELWMEGSTLKAKAHADRTSDALEMTYGNDLREVNISADLAMQRSSVSVCGWDVSAKAAIQHEATESILSSELSGRLSGPNILQGALGERKEALAHTVPFTAQEARNMAETYLKLSARRFVVARGTAEANIKLRVGGKVDLKGLGPLFNGKYYVTEVRCMFDGEKGLYTDFVAESPGLGRA